MGRIVPCADPHDEVVIIKAGNAVVIKVNHKGLIILADKKALGSVMIRRRIKCSNMFCRIGLNAFYE